MVRLKLLILKIVLWIIISRIINPFSIYNTFSQVSLSGNISTPDTVTTLLINFGDENNQFQNLGKFRNIKEIQLQEMQNSDIDKLKNLICPQLLIIIDSPDLSLEDFFKSSINFINISNLTFQGNQLSKLPDAITDLKSLRRLSVIDNNEINSVSFFESCKLLPNLQSIDLSGNQFASLSSAIPDFKNIRSLDIKDNLLVTSYAFINRFPSLDSLMMEENMFSDPVNEILKLKNKTIKYISLDSSAALDENWATVRTQFPQTTFKLVPDLSSVKRKSEITKALPDSITFSLKQKNDTLPNDSFEVGEFKLERNTFKILSDAYIHYPRLFPLINMSFDSLLFEERFEDLNYINNVKKTRTFRAGKIHLKYGKRYSRNIIFYIYPLYGYDSRNYAELSVYYNTRWVYKNKDYKRWTFKKKFIGTKNHPIMWNDIKIVYNAEDNEYELILKNDTTFYHFNCYIKKFETPFSFNKKHKSETASIALERANLKRYLRYMKLRTARENRVNKSILKNKNTYESAMMKFNNTNWINFQKMYMSDQERKMTKAQWLEYYEKVIADEPGAIKNSDVSSTTLKRALEIDGYSKTFSAFLVKDTIPIETCALQFNDMQGNILAVSQLTVILPQKHSYLALSGTMNSDYLQTVLPLNEKVMFVVQTVSGKIGVANSADVEKARKDRTALYKIPVKMLNNKIATVGQVYNILLW